MTRYCCLNPHLQDVINAQNSPNNLNGNLVDQNAQFAASMAINYKSGNLVGTSAIKDFKLAVVSVMGTDSQFLSRFNPISNEIKR